MPGWQGEGIGFTMFPAPVERAPDALGVWRALAGAEEPESFSKPQGPIAMSQASGLFEGLNLQIHCQPGRIHGLFNARQVPSTGDELPRLIDDIEAALQATLRIAAVTASTWKCVRLALICNLANMVPDKAAALAAFQELVPQVPAIGEASDLQFQVNVRKPAAVGAHTLNRLCRFGVAEYRFMNVAVMIGDASQGQPQPVVSGSYDAAYAHFDFNTVPTNVAIDPDEAAALYAVMVEDVRRVSTLGLKALIDD